MIVSNEERYKIMAHDLKMTKNGIDVEIRVNTMNGNFEATVGNERLAAPTWAELEKLVDRATKRVARTVKIVFTRVIQNYRTDDVIVKTALGVATGLHSGNGNVLAQVNGFSVQLSRYDRSQGEFYRPLTRAEAAEYQDLLRAERLASEAVRAWRKERELNLEALVIEALNAGAAPKE